MGLESQKNNFISLVGEILQTGEEEGSTCGVAGLTLMPLLVGPWTLRGCAPGTEGTTSVPRLGAGVAEPLRFRGTRQTQNPLFLY